MFVVGVGSSAGGLEALLPFVAQLSYGNKMTYIIVQHIPARYGSILVELLSRETKLTVREAEDGVIPLEDTIYVAPKSDVLSIEQGCLKLHRPDLVDIHKSVIDYFFASLAQSYQDKSIGIVFSGSGYDGAEGLKAIKAAGGITIAQLPRTAKFDSMPKAAIACGNVDLVLSPVETALNLEAIAKKLDKREVLSINARTPDTIEHIVDNMLKTTDMDFIHYKNSTITRQVRRRMAILQIDDLDTYDRYTQDNPEELTRLAQNFLVCVTSFFRDAQSFNALRLALKEIISGKRKDDEIRIWVPGCATGEEVYTIAILLAEELGDELYRYRVQIYGTDINADAIRIARKGEYSELSVAGLDKSLRGRYFFSRDQNFVVSKQLREWVVFSRQDLIRNPPFIRLDLISCRNLLIYLDQVLQEQVLKIFHFALVTNGILFLGQAESLWSLSDAFTQLDRSNKVFRKNNRVDIRPELNAKKPAKFNFYPLEKTIRPYFHADKIMGQDKLVDVFAPPSILTSREGRILEIYKDCDPFIRIKQGRADFNLFSIIDPALKNELKAFCHHALSSKKTIVTPPVSLSVDGNKQSYRMHVFPLCNPQHQHDDDELLLIAFEEITDQPSVTDFDDNSLRLTDLEHELKTARETLQTVTEALEVSVEEWQLISEEAQTYNEELQSTNEELETSNEELQSINEELNLVNDELTAKTQELAETNDDLKNVLDSIERAVIVVDGQLQITRFNDASRALLNLGVADLERPSLEALEFMFADDFSAGIKPPIRLVIESKQSRRYKLSRQDRYFELVIYPYRSRQAQNCSGAVLTLHDITDRSLIEQQTRLSASVFEAANEAIVITDKDNRIITVNPAFTHITGYTISEVAGKDPKVLSSGQQGRQFYQTMWDTLKKSGKWQGEIWNKRKNGEAYIEWLSICAFKDEKGETVRYIGIFSDISESFKEQQMIMRQANYDALTNLPNRNMFYDRLQQEMAKARRTNKLIGVMFIDLDGFKEINDALGHSQGDQVIQHVAMRMVKVARESDTFARFGGDEFVVMISDMESESDVIPVTEKILEAVQKPIIIDDHELNITASIGITIFPNDGNDVETLLKHADNAMYTAKAEGRNAYRFFTSAMHDKVKQQYRIANDIKNAVKSREFSVFFQPVYDFGLQRIVGAEALIRWNHPTRGFVSPDEFIPVAESLNLISVIGEFVLERACKFIAELNAGLPHPLSIAINFSSLQFVSANCAERWLGIMKDAGINPNNVVIEITESLMMNSQDQYVQQLQLLRRQGVQIALDDFGTGFSSLSYLKNLPFDILKIDKSFVRDILEDPSDASLVESILAIAKNFSLDVIAEGVEEKGQADFLVDRGCQCAQGYFFGKPVPEEQFKEQINVQTTTRPLLTSEEFISGGQHS